MAKKIVVGPGLTPDWLRKRHNVMKAIDERLVLGLENPGKGLTLTQLQARAVEDRYDGCKCMRTGATMLAPLKYDKTRDGWTLLEDVLFDLSGQDGKLFVPDIVEFLKPNEFFVNGEEMKRRGREELNAHLGQHHAEYLMEHQELIPKEWRGKYYLVFPGTVWQGSYSRRLVPYLHWDGDRWCLDFHWLRGDWGPVGRLVCFRK